ncbi:MAG: tRNA uridine-5-carboxymethylaminomethyl(34) synthesis GTPase MnmE [Anaerovoracaceae bacterium]
MGVKMDSTIAAISTAFGEGGIGIIRISGDKAEEILAKIFKTDFKIENRKMTYGHIVDPQNNQVIDEVLCVLMKGPHTYTKEDVVEINCHGSIVSLRKTLALVLKMGARPAERGEFTKRAFLNGRLDLSQAEAVIDVIRAKTDKTFDVALGQLDGSLSREIEKIRGKILDLLVSITVNIDYPDEDIEEILYSDMEKEISLIGDMIAKLTDTADTGRILSEGLNISIIGKPNVGKSSLMNALLRETRAIVTEIPGTTRDTIEETISIKNIPIRLTDTAGIRNTKDEIERIGIEKSKEAFNRADLIIFMLDMSRELSEEDKEIMDIIGQRKAIVLANKIDLETKVDLNQIKNKIPQGIIIETSMKNNEGINIIEEEVEKMVYGGQVSQGESLVVTNVRHNQLLLESLDALRDAKNMTNLGEALEFIEIDVKKAYELLGEIIGETVSEDIINEVFARFCLGK